MALSVALNFEDGVTRFIEPRAGETIADSSYRTGINIPLDCRDGACGTCKCRVLSGQFERGDYIEDALTDEEAGQGLALACQARPKTDMVIDIFASSEICRTGAQTHQAWIKSVDRLSPTATSFTLDSMGSVNFLPGQYANLLVPGTDQRRSFSFASPPNMETLSFLTRDIECGVMSRFLRCNARPGSTIEFIGPFGSFYLREVKRPLLFLAGGTGLAPFLSMLGRLAHTGAPHPVHLVYGVTNDNDLIGTDLLDAYARQVPGFAYRTVVAAPGSAHPRRGYVMSHIEPAHLNGGDIDVYLCGPPPMVDAVRSWLDEQGIRPASFHYEKFSPSGTAAPTDEANRAAA